MYSFFCYDLMSKMRIESSYQLHGENMPLGPMNVGYNLHSFTSTVLEPNIFDISYQARVWIQIRVQV